MFFSRTKRNVLGLNEEKYNVSDSNPGGESGVLLTNSIA